MLKDFNSSAENLCLELRNIIYVGFVSVARLRFDVGHIQATIYLMIGDKPHLVC